MALIQLTLCKVYAHYCPQHRIREQKSSIVASTADQAVIPTAGGYMTLLESLLLEVVALEWHPAYHQTYRVGIGYGPYGS